MRWGSGGVSCEYSFPTCFPIASEIIVTYYSIRVSYARVAKDTQRERTLTTNKGFCSIEQLIAELIIYVIFK